MRSWEFIVREVADKIKQQVANRWKAQDPTLSDDSIRFYLDRWDRFSPGFPRDQRDITRLTFKQVEQLIDGAQARQQLRGRAPAVGKKDPADALYNQNNLEIYRGDLREKCIIYGEGYSWCISRRDASNMFWSYRMNLGEPMFYFVFDLDRHKTDPWHAVVIYVDQEMTYHVALATNPGDREMTWREISREQPKLANLKKLFKPQPLTATEKAEYEKYKKPRDLKAYQGLSLEEKHQYIMFGHYLTAEQQTATPQELIGVYAKQQSLNISKETWQRLSPGDRKKVEENQIKEVEQDGLAIENILEAGIIPSEAVQIAAVTENGKSIQYIFEAGIPPTEPVMLAAVTNFSWVLKTILKYVEPPESVIRAAADREPLVFKWVIEQGLTPSEPVMMIGVVTIPGAIKTILDAGIRPSDRVLMAAIHIGGIDALEYMVSQGIRPSEELRRIARVRVRSGQ